MAAPKSKNPLPIRSLELLEKHWMVKFIVGGMRSTEAADSALLKGSLSWRIAGSEQTQPRISVARPRNQPVGIPHGTLSHPIKTTQPYSTIIVVKRFGDALCRQLRAGTVSMSIGCQTELFTTPFRSTPSSVFLSLDYY